MNNFTTIILAAGQGIRLRPLTNDIPKCLVKVNEKPLLNYQLDLFENSGIKNIIAVTGYRKEKIIDNRIINIENPEYDSTNMIFSLMCAEKYLKGNVIISYGDIIYSNKVLTGLMNDTRDIVIASDVNWLDYWKLRFENPLEDAETFQKEKNGFVKSLGQKTTSINDIEGQFIGLIKLSGTGCEVIREKYFNCQNDSVCNLNAWNSNRTLRKSFMTDMLNSIAAEKKLNYFEIDRGWFEIDNLMDLKIAEQKINSIL